MQPDCPDDRRGFRHTEFPPHPHGIDGLRQPLGIHAVVNHGDPVGIDQFPARSRCLSWQIATYPSVQRSMSFSIVQNSGRKGERSKSSVA
ncbi:MAG: hypothetical protein U0231_18970 [Nitrospiraceae bacterium]